MLPGEADAVGELRVRAYRAQDLLKADYADALRTLGRDGRGTILVAADESPGSGGAGPGDADSGGAGPGSAGSGSGGADPGGDAGPGGTGSGGGTGPRGADSGGAGPGSGAKLLGTVMYEPWHSGSEVARSADEAEVRAFAVAPWAQGRGIGRALMRTVIDQVAASGAARLVLSTQPAMTAAQNLYRSLGFTRVPELDWSPAGDLTLLAFALPLPPA